MLNLPQLESAMKTNYPSSISSTTQKKRKENIDAIWSLIDSQKDKHNLQYGEHEARLEIFHTVARETISIQFPGKESIEIGEKYRPYDFRPKIQTSDGTVLRDFVFKDMWSLVEQINTTHPNMLKTLATLFFQLGRMTNHTLTTEKYRYVLLDANGKEISSSTESITWNKLTIRKDILESLNFFIPLVHIDEETAISFEAFLYFFDMILQNEDSKYYYKKENLTSGRIQTSDSMLLLVSYFSKHTSLSTLLQRYVSGFGVGKCLSCEIEPATDNLVKLVNRKEELQEYLTDIDINYTINRPITVEGERIQTALKTNSPQIAILNESVSSKKEKLESRNWQVFDFESATDPEYYQLILNAYSN